MPRVEVVALSEGLEGEVGEDRGQPFRHPRVVVGVSLWGAPSKRKPAAS